MSCCSNRRHEESEWRTVNTVSNSDAEIKQFYAKKSLRIRRYEADSLSVLEEQMLFLLFF